jgi:hypothetical protein
MPDIAAADVVYTVLKPRQNATSQKANLVRLAFGNGVDTVPAGGIPLLPAKMGCPVIAESVQVVAQGTSGFVFNYNKATGNLVILQGDNANVAAGPLVATTAAIAAQTIEVEVVGW